MPALSGQHGLAPALSHQPSHAEAGAGAQDQHRPLGRPAEIGPQHPELVRSQPRRAQGLGGEVVEQPRRLEAADAGQPRLGHLPVEVGEMHGAVGDRAGHRQHHLVRPGRAGSFQIGLDGLLGGRVVPGRIGLDLRWGAAAVLDQGKAGVGAAQVPHQACHLRRTAPRRRGRRRRRWTASSRTSRGRSRSWAAADAPPRGPSAPRSPP